MLERERQTGGGGLTIYDRTGVCTHNFVTYVRAVCLSLMTKWILLVQVMALRYVLLVGEAVKYWLFTHVWMFHGCYYHWIVSREYMQAIADG